MSEADGEYAEFGTSSPSVGTSLWSLLGDRLGGRWRWTLALGVVIGLAAGIVGFRTVSPQYTARGLVQVEVRLPTLVTATPETEELDNTASFLGSQAELMRDQRVLADALKSDQFKPYLAAMGEDPVAFLRESLDVLVVRNTTLIAVECTTDDRRLAQTVVNGVMESYFRIYGPNAETQHTRTIQQVRTLLTDARRRLTDLEGERARLLKGSQYGTLDVSRVVEEQVSRIAALQLELASVNQMRTSIEEQALKTNRPVVATDYLEPSDRQLVELDEGLRDLAGRLESEEAALSSLMARLGQGHPVVRQVLSRVTSLRDGLAARQQELRASWGERVQGRENYGALTARTEEISAELLGVRETIDRINTERSRLEQVDRDAARVMADIRGLENRMSGLETESEVIRQGRVTIRAMATLPGSPSRDRRLHYGILGFMGGFGVSLASFFILGTVDRRAFAAKQLESDRHRLRPLGVVPDMGKLGDTDEERVLLEDCVHRIRNRIESRREQSERGYAIKVSSPFQGDGKTSIAAALAWSYAQAGYRTLMLDLDFIGRALSSQFGMLDRPGVREALRDPENLERWIVPVRPNLEVLPAGSDVNVSAGHLQPAAMRGFIDVLKDRYDILLLDTGPMTASVESLPVLGAVDGVVLVLRRGRSRRRLVQCIEDVVHLGARFLGVVLNQASLSDCQQYSSLSRVSMAPTSTGESEQSGSSEHPIVSALGRRSGQSEAM